MNIRYLIVGVLGLALFSLAAVGQQEGKVTGAEAKEVQQAIEDYIQRDIELKGGFFLYDSDLKRVVGMKFDHVHEGVTRMTDGQFFACVDMRSVRGPLYDLDVYLEETDEGLKPTRLVVHKVDGQKRE